MNKILIVGEEEDTIKKAQQRLSLGGFEIFIAYDGQLALQIAKEKIPDLIITDAVVPVMSGFEFCKAIKSEEETKSIPVIVFTDMHRMEDSFMFLGIKNFLNKPINLDELETVVRKTLDFSQMMQLQKTKVLVYGRPEVLACCQQLLKSGHHWNGYYSDNAESFMQDAVKHEPDVIFMDLLMPEVPVDELIKKIKLIPELKNTAFLTYYVSTSINRDPLAVQAQMIEVQYMKRTTQEAGADEYVGPFNPVTFLNLIDIYRRDFKTD